MNVNIRMCSKCRARPVNEGQRWCWKCRKPKKATREPDSAGVVSAAKGSDGRTVNEANAGTTPSAQSGPATPAAYIPFAAGRPLRDEVWFDAFLSDLAVNGSPALAAAAAVQHIDVVERLADENPAFGNEIVAASRYYRELLEWQSVNVGRTKNSPLPFFARLKKELPGGYVEKNLNVNIEASMAHDRAMEVRARDIMDRIRGNICDAELRAMGGLPAEAEDGQSG
jgi:hypothetical protein